MEKNEDLDDFIFKAPKVLPDVKSSLKSNAAKTARKGARSKRKMIGNSPNSKEQKQKQMTLNSFVTRLKRRKSLLEIDPAASTCLTTTLLNTGFTPDKFVTSLVSNHMSKQPASFDPVKETDIIACTIKTLKFSNDEESSSSSDNQVPAEKSIVVIPESDILEDQVTCSQNPGESVSWLSDVDWESDALPSNSKMNDSNGENTIPIDSRSSKYKVCGISKSAPREVELLLCDPRDISSVRNICLLRGFWTDTIVREGDEVRVLAAFTDGCAIIDDQSGFLVVNPDFLISSTAIVSTLFCMRKAALSHKFRHWDSTNKVMMIGSFVHQIFQQAMSDHYYSQTKLEDILDKILRRTDNIISMYCQGLSEDDMKQEFSVFVPSISQWMEQYCSTDKKSDMRVTAVRDIEDNIWCPRFGVKGKIDLTVEVQFPKLNAQALMPLELKTGASSFSSEHQGQVNLYSLMLEERTGDRCDGLLLYLKNQPEMKQIPADHNAQRGLIQLRNELVYYVSKSTHFPAENLSSEKSHWNESFLPEPLNSKRLCQKCPYLLPCTTYQRAYNTVSSNNSHAMSSLVPKTTLHITDVHLDFFKHWSYLLNLESGSSSIKRFWNEDAQTREKEGLCLSHMILKEEFLSQQSREGGAFIHKFFRSIHSPIHSSLASVGLQPGDYVAISNQDNTLEVALATGFVVLVAEDSIDIAVERDIQQLRRYEHYVFRLDKQVSGESGSLGLANLMKLMTSDAKASALRQLIIERRAPEFQETMSKNVAFVARPFVKSLNKPQRKAVFKALMAKDYMLLKGMPGAGKTSTIVAMVRFLLAMKCTVLLSSHTHSAVDNILLKLLEHDTDFLRMGQLPKIHPKVLPYSFEMISRNITQVSDLQALIKSKKVIATTCLGINHVILKKLYFDVCIIDESSQITLPDCIGPLYHAKKFILVGDPKQLPPVVVNEQAKIHGLQDSLFVYLETSENCMELPLQYRMNREIMSLCNSLAYNGVMQCGSQEIEMATLQLSNVNENLLSYPWLSSALDGELKNSVFFLDTDRVPASETRNTNGKVQNETEGQLVLLIVKQLIQAGLSPSDVGVITPYRCQVQLINKGFSANGIGTVEVNTVDQYQGRDKEVIVISCVRSKCDENQNTASTIMGDMRRLTVAISRAKKKLLIFGSKSTLTHYACFAKLFQVLRTDQIISLPTDAHLNC